VAGCVGGATVRLLPWRPGTRLRRSTSPRSSSATGSPRPGGPGAWRRLAVPDFGADHRSRPPLPCAVPARPQEAPGSPGLRRRPQVPPFTALRGAPAGVARRGVAWRLTRGARVRGWVRACVRAGGRAASFAAFRCRGCRCWEPSIKRCWRRCAHPPAALLARSLPVAPRPWRSRLRAGLPPSAAAQPVGADVRAACWLRGCCGWRFVHCAGMA
jgi:hypothetical protein